MLELQMGMNRDARRKRTMQVVRELQDKGFAQIYILVPEQSTFVMSRDVCAELGNERYNHGVEVLGFENLFRRVHSELGERRDTMDEGGRLLAMAQAAEETRAAGLLKSFHAISSRPEYLQRFLTAYSTFELHGADRDTVLAAAEETEDEKLRDKLTDLEHIFDAYNRICAAGAKDPTQEIKQVTGLIARHGWASGAAFIVDGFTDLPTLQMVLIRQLIADSPFVLVSLEAAGLDDEHPATAIAAQTGKKLAEAAAELHVDCEVVRTGDRSTEHPALAFLQRHLCDYTQGKPEPIEGAEKVVRLFTDNSPYRECQHIVGTILRATRKGYRYRETSIVLCDYDRYAPILETVARRYQVPMYFGSRRDEIVKKPVMSAVFNALDSATRGMQREDVLNYLKSGLSNLLPDEVDQLENYIRLYNIHGPGWEPGEEGWIGHPDGYGLELDDGAAETLAAINDYRVRGIGPLLRLRDAMKAAVTLRDYLEGLYGFLEDIHFTESLQTMVDTLMADGQDQTAMEYSQVSEVLNHAMEQMYDVIGGQEKRGGEFVKLLRLLCSAYKIATIPATVDQVQVLSLEDARYICSRIRYIAGAEEGVFPAYTPGSSLFSTAEITDMKALGIAIPGGVEDMTSRGLSDIQTVVAGAKRVLVLSYASDPTAPSTPSHLYTRIQQFFPDIAPSRGAGENGIYEADLLSPEMAGRLAGRIANRAAYDEITFSLCNMPHPELQKTACRLMDKADWALRDLSDASVEGLYGERISMTATRMDVYSSCRYNFFLRYGLKLKEPPRSGISSPIFGKFAHEVLEKTIRDVEEKHGGFQHVTEETMRSIAQGYIVSYTKEKMRGLLSQPERYMYLYKRHCREIMSVMDDICSEFQASDFHCSAFELKVGGEGADLPPIPITGSRKNGTFTGILDRVDTCMVNDRLYFRVCDYKTGRTKSFDLTDILSGMSTQLLLYQGALRQDEFEIPGREGETAAPAGVLYVPAKTIMVSTPAKVDDKKLEALREKELTRRGILLDSKDVLNAMEHPGEGGKTRYLPIKYAADGKISGEVCSEAQLHMLDDYAKATMADAVDDIASGSVAANPVSRGPKRSACTYCPMKAACHKDVGCGAQQRYLSKVSSDQFWKTIEEKLDGAGA